MCLKKVGLAMPDNIFELFFRIGWFATGAIRIPYGRRIKQNRIVDDRQTGLARALLNLSFDGAHRPGRYPPLEIVHLAMVFVCISRRILSMGLPSSQRVNYDLIAPLYDEPLRDHNIDPNLIRFLSEQTTLRSSDIRILDMGCGTGKQLSANREQFPDQLMVGLDLFQGMLRQAQKRCTAIAWVQGDSSKPPFKDNSFDYITNQFSYPHVLDKPKMIVETYRVLKPGGRFVMTNLDPWSMPGWIVYMYFPAARQRDFKDFLPVEEFAAMMNEAGFSNIQISRQHRHDREDLKQFVEYASQRYRTSQLMAIQDSDYQAGIAKLIEEIRKCGDNTWADSEICLVTLTGDKP
jgi:SAM-dependent methyltransferase